MPDVRLRKFSWFVLTYNVVVILFGAVVRATGSGAGCGSDWPTCQGGVVPLTGTSETAIEFTHRATSGIALILVFLLLVWVLKSRPAGDVARIAAIAAAVLVVNEALVGAMLVLFGWVEDDQSMGRAVSIAVHLINTFLLLGALSLTAWWLGDGSRQENPHHSAQFEESVGGPGPGVPLSGLWSEIHRRTPCKALGGWRRDKPTKYGTFV